MNKQVFLTFLLVLAAPAAVASGPWMATGLKIGEVTDSSAIVWVRLTQEAERVDFGGPMPVITYTHADTGEPVEVRQGQRPNHAVPKVVFPGGSSVYMLEGAVPGAKGIARIQYRPEGSPSFQKTAWQDVDPMADFTAQFRLSGLGPATPYHIAVEFGASVDADLKRLSGSFRTAPAADTVTPVTFTVVTGQAYKDRDTPDGYRIYEHMGKLDPDFFVHTGDILYYDYQAKSMDLANWHWQRMYSMGSLVEFHRNVASYFMKDDHDTWVDDAWPTMKSHFMGDFTFEQGVKIFLDQVPMGDRTYRTIRWGKDLQIWLVEGRDYRSANDAPDSPDKTIWGDEQMAWFKRTVKASDAAFRVLISPTPVVGPDRGNKRDNHANEGFAYEGNLLREFIAAQKNMVVVCGDRHWQYVSEDLVYGVREYSTGPVSDEHAGGWSNDKFMPEHRYLNVIGGFLAVTVERRNGKPILIGRHYGVDGRLLNEDEFVTE